MYNYILRVNGVSNLKSIAVSKRSIWGTNQNDDVICFDDIKFDGGKFSCRASQQEGKLAQISVFDQWNKIEIKLQFFYSQIFGMDPWVPFSSSAFPWNIFKSISSKISPTSTSDLELWFLYSSLNHIYEQYLEITSS